MKLPLLTFNSSKLRKRNSHRSTKTPLLPSREGLLEGGPTTVASMNACLQSDSIGACRGKATYCVQKRVFVCFYHARLLRTAIFNVCLVALDDAVFFGLLEFHHNAAPGYINEAEVRRS